MSAYLTHKLAEQAIDLAEPSIGRLLANITNRYAGHLRVSALLDGVWRLVATRDFSEKLNWEHPYAEVAESKDFISRRTGMSSREIQQMHPELTEPGDTIYYGNAVSPTIIVSYSGVEGYFDELIAKWVLDACLALIQHDLEGQKADGNNRYS